MGILFLAGYFAASAAFVFAPPEAKIGICALAFLGIYWVIHTHKKITTAGLGGVALRVLVTLVFWTVLFSPAYVFFRISSW